MTKSSRKNVLNAGIDLGTACIPSGIATNQATAPGGCINNIESQITGIKSLIALQIWQYRKHTESLVVSLGRGQRSFPRYPRTSCRHTHDIPLAVVRHL